MLVPGVHEGIEEFEKEFKDSMIVVDTNTRNFIEKCCEWGDV